MHLNVKRFRQTHSLDCVNWPSQYPYKPTVKFSIAHDSDSIFLEFEVAEKWSRALADDMGKIWEDSTVEVFLSPNPEDGLYYNIECNCAGSLLVRAGHGRHERESAPDSVIAGVKRFSTVENRHFDSEYIPVWNLALIIPKETFFLHDVKTLDGAHFRGNIYKCGDALPEPHFISFAPIATAEPDFHRPEFFADIDFE